MPVPKTFEEFMQQLEALFASGNGITLKQLQQARELADKQLALQQRQLEQVGIPQIAIQARLADLQGEQADRMYELAVRQQNFAEEMGRRQQDFNEEVGRGNLGLNYLTTAAKMGGPGDWIAAERFNAGAREVGQLPTWISTLQRNAPGFAWAGPTGSPGPVQSPELLASKMTTAPAGSSALPAWLIPDRGIKSTGNPATDRALLEADRIFQAGGGSFAPGVLESLDPTQMQMLGGAGDALGYDVSGFLNRWKRSRIGQQAAMAA